MSRKQNLCFELCLFDSQEREVGLCKAKSEILQIASDI